ncbi:MAG: OmpA family protein [Nitrospirota bacterium]
MSTTVRAHIVLVSMGLLSLVIGCTGKQISVSVEGQAMLAKAGDGGRGMQESVLEDLALSGPGRLQEVRVTDPAEVLPVAPAGASGSDGESPASAAARGTMEGSENSALGDVFFDYDRSSIRKEARAVLEANARMLKEREGWTLLITGHCDERGSQAYNQVLGERRAQSVKRYLEDLGLLGAQIRIVSYGKDHPFCAEPTSECWQKNRRAHFAMR